MKKHLIEGNVTTEKTAREIRDEMGNRQILKHKTKTPSTKSLYVIPTETIRSSPVQINNCVKINGKNTIASPSVGSPQSVGNSSDLDKNAPVKD